MKTFKLPSCFKITDLTCVIVIVLLSVLAIQILHELCLSALILAHDD